MLDLLCAANESQGIRSAFVKSRFSDSVLFASDSQERWAGGVGSLSLLLHQNYMHGYVQFHQSMHRVKIACFYIRIICMVTFSFSEACIGVRKNPLMALMIKNE